MYLPHQEERANAETNPLDVFSACHHAPQDQTRSCVLRRELHMNEQICPYSADLRNRLETPSLVRRQRPYVYRPEDLWLGRRSALMLTFQMRLAVCTKFLPQL